MAGIAPAPATGTADDGAVGSAQEQAERLPVRNPGRFDIECVQPFFEQTDFFRSWLDLQDHDRRRGGVHDILPAGPLFCGTL